ncbi:patatin-like phospholipase family protein [Nocardia sp. NPDC055053]
MGDDLWYVDSPGIGTGRRQEPCRDSLRPEEPTASSDAVALTLSGGGFRATLPAVGVVRLLADTGMLANVRYASSVSGGSVANALVASAWPALRDRGFTAQAVDELVIAPLVGRVSRRSLKFSLVRGAWRTVGPLTRTELLARRLDEWFFSGRLLSELDPEVRWIVNAANQVSGVRFTFERDVVGDYTIGLIPTGPTGMPLSLAVAASAAVPGAFAPVVLDRLTFPCANHAPALLDGGTYDNTGIEALSGEHYRHAFLVCLNAGGLLTAGSYGKIPLVRDLARANSLLYRQSITLRTRWIVERFERGRATASGPVPEGARHGVLFALATNFPEPPTETLTRWRDAFPEHRTYRGRDLSEFPTVFDKLDAALCRALVYRGWWLAGAALATHYPERLPDLAALNPPEL